MTAGSGTTRRAATLFARVLGSAALAASLATASAGDESPLRKAESDLWSDRRDACKALAQDESPECVKKLARLVRDDADTLVRDEAVAECRLLATDDAVDVVAATLDHATPLGRRNLVAGLARTRRPRALDALLRVARGEADPWVRTEAIEATWYFDPDPRSLEICKACMRSPDAMTRATALHTAGRMATSAGRDLVVAGWPDADEGVGCAALGAMTIDDALPHLTEAAAAKGWRMRAQCVDTALRWRRPECVDVLIGLTGDRLPRVQWAALRALRFLTGKDYGPDPDVWRAWWQANRAKWVAPKGRPNDVAEKPPAAGETRADFVGLSVETDRAVFVLDASSSMDAPIQSGGTRADAVRRELQRTLDALPDGIRVNVILFNDKVRPCWDAARPLTAKARRDAVAFAASVRPDGRTDLLGAALRAVADELIDTVYLLTDGVPSTGDIAADGRVRAAIVRANRIRKVAIHTIGFGVTKDADRRFLVDLASDGGGRSAFR